MAITAILLLAGCQPVQTNNACVGGWFPIHPYHDDKVPFDLTSQIQAENGIGERFCGWLHSWP